MCLFAHVAVLAVLAVLVCKLEEIVFILSKAVLGRFSLLRDWISTFTFFFMSHSNVYSEAEVRELAAQVDRVLPPTLSFFRYGDRITHIIRFLIENEMDVAKTIVAIKQTALFRKYWHADEIAITDVQKAFSEMHCFPTGVTADGKIVWYADCFIQHPVNVEDFMLASIYMLDDLQRQLYEECKARGIREAYKDYCIIVSDTARTSMSALTTDIQKAGFDVFIRHFPSFMSVSNIFIDENPQYKPVYSWETSTVFNMNTALYLRVLWNMCTFFLPSRWAYMVQLLGGQALPSTIPPSFIPSKYGGESHCTFENWLEACAQRDNVALDTPPRSLVDERVLKQFGKNSGMIASEIPGTVLKGWLWKRTNAGHRWHHYYFVALGEGILYYFKTVDDTNAQNG